MLPIAAIALTTAFSGAPDLAAREAKVKEIFKEWCTTCHYGKQNPPNDPEELNLEVPLGTLVGMKAATNGKPLVTAGDPFNSYLYIKMKGAKNLEGELMPLGDDRLPAASLKAVADWIKAIPEDGGVPAAPAASGGGKPAPAAEPAPAPEPAKADPAKEARVKEIFDDKCTSCHSGGGNPADDPSEIDLEVAPSSLIGIPSAENGKPMVVPGDPAGSYLLLKMTGGEGMDGELMPMGDEMTPDELAAITDWIASLPVPVAAGGGGATAGGGGGAVSAGGGGGEISAGGTPGVPAAPKRKPRKPFNGTSQIALPTTTTLGKRTLQYRIDHRFGRIGTERGAFGLDAGVAMAMGLQYGIIDGLDVQLRRANSRKTWELGVKYIPIRQEDGKALSFGGYVAASYLRDFDVGNPFTGDFQAMVSHLWFDRWSTMLTLGYHLNTNHNSRVTVDFGDGAGAVAVRDRRDTLTMGLASTVLLGKKKKWGIDMEYVLPIPDGGSPNVFYYRGGDADPAGSRIGSWSLGGSLRTAKHFFQVFFTNNREIATNLHAPGGQSGNPFSTPGVDSSNPFHKFNFFLGFNLGRQFSIKAGKKKKDKKKDKK